MGIDDLMRPNAFRKKLCNSYFLTIGRALAVAQHFESICRAVADFLDIKRAVHSGEASPNDVEFSDFVARIQKRMLGGAVNRLGGLPGIPDDISSILEKAKNARNRIAHDCTVSTFHPLAEEETMWASLEQILIDIRSITQADKIVSSLLYMMNEHEPLYVPSNYVQSVIDWVFDEFQGEDFVEEQGDGEQAGAGNRRSAGA